MHPVMLQEIFFRQPQPRCPRTTTSNDTFPYARLYRTGNPNSATSERVFLGLLELQRSVASRPYAPECVASR